MTFDTDTSSNALRAQDRGPHAPTDPDLLLSQGDDQELADLRADLHTRLDECWALLGAGRSLRNLYREPDA